MYGILVEYITSRAHTYIREVRKRSSPTCPAGTHTPKTTFHPVSAISHAVPTFSQVGG